MWLLVCITIVFAFLWIQWRRVKFYWAERGVGHDPMHPLYGSLHFMTVQNPALWMRKLYERRKEPYTGIWLLWKPALVIHSPDIARRVLVKDSEHFRNRLVGTGIARTDPLGGLNLFTINDPMWTTLRRRLTPVFTSAKLRMLQGLVISKANELLQRIENDLAQNKPIELRSLYSDYSSDVIGTAAFGVECNATLTGKSPIRTVTQEFMEYDFYRGWGWCSIFFSPELVHLFRFTFFPRRSTDYFRSTFKSILAQRGGYAGKRDHNDLLDFLLKMKHEADLNGEDMDEDLVIAQAVIFLQGGFDTSAVTLSYMTYELAFQPDIQDKLYNELLEAQQRTGEKELDGNTLSELTYLNCIIKETLRKYPAMGWLDRVAAIDYQIDEKLTIRAGTPTYVNAVGMHFDPEYYPEPNRFNPDRFLPENDNGRTPFTFLPFGEGPRSCIGERFAYRTLWHAASKLFLKYQVRPKPNAKKPNDVEVERRALFLMPGEPLYVDYNPRE